MADGDRQLAFTTGPVPTAVQVSGPDRLTPKAVNASFDGSGAAGDFLPCLIITGRTGLEVARITAPVVAAGASAEVSWFPRVGGGISKDPSPVLDDYVFRFVNLSVTGVGFASRANLLIQGNPITFDGVTRVKIECFVPSLEIINGAPNQALGFELWDHFAAADVNKGTIAYWIGSNVARANAGFNVEVGGPVKAEIILTPAAGVHTYSIYCWRNVAPGGATTVFASTFVDGSGNLAPAWYRAIST